MDHSFKKDSTATGCCVCLDEWPSAGDTLTEFLRCQSCGKCVHGSCKRIAGTFVRCSAERSCPTALDGTVSVRLKQVAGLSCSAGTLVYGQFKVKGMEVAMRTETSLVSSQEGSWFNSDNDPFEVDFRGGEKMDMRIEIWSSFYEVLNKKLYKVNINMHPAYAFMGKRFERWFPLIGLVNGSDKARVLLEIYVVSSHLRYPAQGSFVDEESEPEWSVKIPTRSVSSLIAAQQVPTVLHDASNHSLQSSFSVTASTENSSQSASLASENISDLTLEGPPGSVQCTGHIQHHNLSEQEISSIVRHLDKLPDTLSSSLPVPSLHEDSEVNSLSPEAENPEAPAKFPTQIDSEECRQSPAQELLIPVTPSRSGELPSSASQSTDTKLVPLSQSDTRIDGTSIESHPPIDSSSVDQVRQVIPSSETASFGSSFFSSVTDSFAKLGNVFYELETSLDSKMDTAATEDESQKGSENGAIAPKESVGVLHLSVQAIFLFDLVLADEIRLSLQIYYVDKSGKKVLFRKPLTRLVNSWTYREKISLSVPHFRAVVLLEVIDVVTERIYGRSKLTAYQVKHRADDSRVNASVYGSSNKSILLLDDKAKSKLGRIDCDLSFEEDLYNHFWSPLVRYCPTSPEEELSIDRLGVHMVRFRAMIDFFNQCFTEYLLIMNWSDPVLTSTLFLLFIYCTIYVKPDYSMSGILFICVLLMTRSWYRRKNGKFRDKYLKPYLADAVAPYHPVATLKIAVLGHHKVVNSTRTIPSLGFSFLSATNDAAHNQIAAFKVTMIPDKAFLNSDVSVDSNSNTSSASAAPAVPTKELPVGVFSTSEDYSRAIGESSGVTQFVNSLIKSEQAKSEFLANTFDPWPLMDRSVFSSFTQHCVEFVQASTAEIGLIYPLLQPVKRKQDLVKEKGSASSSSTIATALTSSSDSLETAKDLSHTTSPGAKRKKFEGRTAETNHAFYSTWTTSTSAVKVSLVQPPTSAFSDYHADEYVLLPIRDILLHGEQVDQGGLYFEYTGWLRCVQTMSKDGNEKREFDLRSLDNSLSKVSLDLSGSARNASLTPITSSSGQNEVLIRASIKLPSVRRLASPTADEKKVSQVLQELLFGRGDKESTTFSVLWNMRDYVKYAQNLMSWILDYFESAKNLFNWTSPQRTFLLYVSLVGLWILTILIPGRILVFIAGLFQFLYIFLPIPEGNELSIWTHNLLQSIPNDDDLMEIYADDRRLVNEAETEKRRREVRDVLLNVSIPVAWAQEAQVKVLRRGGNSSGSAISSSGSIGAVEWVTVFLVVQGHRLAWWTTESDLDKSKAPIGQLILSQVAGFTQVSPVDLKKFGETGAMVGLFGEDPLGKPLKVIIHTTDPVHMQQFKLIVEKLMTDLMD